MVLDSLQAHNKLRVDKNVLHLKKLHKLQVRGAGEAPVCQLDINPGVYARVHADPNASFVGVDRGCAGEAVRLQAGGPAGGEGGGDHAGRADQSADVHHPPQGQEPPLWPRQALQRGFKKVTHHHIQGKPRFSHQTNKARTSPW